MTSKPLWRVKLRGDAWARASRQRAADGAPCIEILVCRELPLAGGQTPLVLEVARFTVASAEAARVRTELALRGFV